MTLSLSNDLPMAVEYRINDMGHITCAPPLGHSLGHYLALHLALFLQNNNLLA